MLFPIVISSLKETLDNLLRRLFAKIFRVTSAPFLDIGYLRVLISALDRTYLRVIPGPSDTESWSRRELNTSYPIDIGS